MSDVDEIMKKYGAKISKQIDLKDEYKVGDLSREYLQFKKELMPALSRYESWAKTFNIKVKPSTKDLVGIQRQLDVAHLDLSPENVSGFAFFSAFLVFTIGLVIFSASYFSFVGLEGDFLTYLMGPAGLFLVLSLFAAMFVFYYLYSMPSRLANSWRLKASAQMVPCILYIVVYMKHTSNLERAVAFASKHLNYPLGLDLKKIFWDVETGKYSTIKESLDKYLETWEKDSLEFVEAFHLIESSLYEPSDGRRIMILEKGLQTILDGVYEKMLAFSREVRSPLTNLYMLGVVLPTLGLALLPLASAFLGDILKVYHVFIFFNLIVPFFVFYLTSQIMLKRPGGYGETDFLELNPDYEKYKSKKHYVTAALIAIPLILIALTPFLLQWDELRNTIGLQCQYYITGTSGCDFDFNYFGLSILGETRVFGFRYVEGAGIVGPFGILAIVLSLFIPLAIGLFFYLSYNSKTKDLIKSRDFSKQLEKEFTNSLFQLGNRIGDGMPAEVAFGRVAESTRGQKTENFFRRINLNLQQGGMSLEKAIFDERRGAIIYYPSALIATSMRILLESVKKGLNIAAQSLMSISEYIKNIQKVTQRLNDLLAEVVSDMKSNMVFLAPLLSGIVVGLSSMIAFLLVRLSGIFTQIGGSTELGGFNIGDFLRIFEVDKMISPYFLQISVGLYIIEIIFILTNVLVVIDAGEDRLKRTKETGNNLGRGVAIYFVITLIAIVLLSSIAAIALGSLQT
ncbi:MAG: hypothetical protein WC796_01675 [Candidatus Pacearchaeota archaeon]|jgi:hypothetical protein